jgi:enamine deaminase RidA (YjgF/YER057c/UK114 family)
LVDGGATEMLEELEEGLRPEFVLVADDDRVDDALAALRLGASAGASVEDPLHLRSAPAEAQARRALQNVLAIVQAAGGAKESVVRLTFYITSVRHWAAVDRACREILGEHRTARSVVPVPELHLGFEVAVEGLASCPDARTAREELVAGRGPW